MTAPSEAPLARRLTQRGAALLLGLVPVVGCASAAPPRPRLGPVASATAPIPAPRVEEPKPEPMTFEEASTRALAIAERWRKAPRYQPAKLADWVVANAPPEAEVRAIVDGLLRGPKDKPTPLEKLIELLGELGDTSPGAPDTTKTLLRAASRGHYQAGLSLERILERRHAAAPVTCSPPTEPDIDRARAGLASFFVVDRRVTKDRGAGLVVRPPTEAELDDLAYLYAAVADAGAPVGSVEEDDVTPQAESAERSELRAKADAAKARGEVEGHLQAGLAYLEALGYPGPIKTKAESDTRWGGPGFAFLMRDLALSAELLGRYELAEALYRRASWAPGVCGSSAHVYRDRQTAGVVRSVELRGACAAAVPERLFAVDDGNGPTRLTERGFDVTRLYRAALLTRNRSDPQALRHALTGATVDGLARLDRLGAEDWMGRLRAIPGFADSAKAGSIRPLLDLLPVADVDARVEVLESFAALAQDRGHDPCLPPPEGFGFLSMSSGSRSRDVENIMGSCDTRLPKKVFDHLVDAVADLARDPEPTTRVAVAQALGKMANPRGRPALTRLARDTYDVGGEVCTSVDGGPQSCQPNRPVLLAAQEALEQVDENARLRAAQRGGRR